MKLNGKSVSDRLAQRLRNVEDLDEFDMMELVKIGVFDETAEVSVFSIEEDLQ